MLDGGAGLQEAHLLDNVEDQIGNGIHAVTTIRCHTTTVDLREVQCRCHFPLPSHQPWVGPVGWLNLIQKH